MACTVFCLVASLLLRGVPVSFLFKVRQGFVGSVFLVLFFLLSLDLGYVLAVICARE